MSSSKRKKNIHVLVLLNRIVLNAYRRVYNHAQLVCRPLNANTSYCSVLNSTKHNLQLMMMGMLLETEICVGRSKSNQKYLLWQLASSLVKVKDKINDTTPRKFHHVLYLSSKWIITDQPSACVFTLFPWSPTKAHGPTSVPPKLSTLTTPLLTYFVKWMTAQVFMTVFGMCK